ncbi:MAG: acetoacetate decarboxylase family protein [Candidatus Freyarchaeota archaeon]|nr:acetoacetate decarboxylase family protein [Candidatus Jordarchaeia archaeon]MBS7279815.1 acetoacetate decarboxylase family protein [Candidatus Jordarchaeia archaeon]
MSFYREDYDVIIPRPPYMWPNARILASLYVSKPDIIQKILPPPLEAGKEGIVLVFIAEYPESNFGVTYNESAMFVQASFPAREGKINGVYCPCMYVDNDVAMIGGREIYGLPKKIAKINLERQGDRVTGTLERDGVTLVDMEAKLTGKIEGTMSFGPTFSLRAFPSPDMEGLSLAEILSIDITTEPKEAYTATGTIKFEKSESDPLYEVEPVINMGMIYTIGTPKMSKGTILYRAVGEDTEKYLPFVYSRSY